MTLEELRKSILSVLMKKSWEAEIKGFILTTVLNLYENYPDKTLKDEYFQSVINGLENLEELIYDTQENLIKNKHLKKNDKRTKGYVTIDRKKMVITKDENVAFVKRILAHEISHLTQDKNSFIIHYAFDYADIVSLALLEGEAVYFENIISSEYKQSVTFEDSEHQALLTSNTFYPIALYIYNIFRELLGEELFNKWRKFDKSSELTSQKLFTEFEVHLKEHHNLDFAQLYKRCVILILNYFKHTSYEPMIISDEKRFDNYSKIDDRLKNHIGDYVDNEAVLNYKRNLIEHTREKVKKYNFSQLVKNRVENKLETIQGEIEEHLRFLQKKERQIETLQLYNRFRLSDGMRESSPVNHLMVLHHLAKQKNIETMTTVEFVGFERRSLK